MTMTDIRRSPSFYSVPADLHGFTWICEQLDRLTIGFAAGEPRLA